MKDEFKSFYKKDLINMINEAALNIVGYTPAEMNGEQITARLMGVLSLTEELKNRLNAPEVE